MRYALIVTFFFLLPLLGGEKTEQDLTEQEKEVLLMAEEDNLAIEGGEATNDSIALTGVVRLQRPAESAPDVVGWIKRSNGKAYLLKVEDPSMLERLRRTEGTPVALIGRVRAAGKYFVASRFETRGVVEPYRGRRKGL